ncbi:TPR domain/radical SAM/B12 binding domain protein [Acidisarcina polymorpha]|uniref:TPR domain/radical SAM/B12 binding domain protein n=1 Tax=Acidisarcina polymorpha TaxID=2211140 RepID=A0A2Z5G763_9BACT|nr:tetratricopeptide repeat protein [Acidisarcina polymorpha]AXC14396.1 TPR domain/radical SAM/B12 binding domain protein [Acidisarcina polymorpha]
MTRIRRQDVLRYLKLHARQLQAWEHKGLVVRRDSYSLEEYGQLRTLRDLSAKFSSSSICASVGAMKSVAGIENPLLEARPVVAGSRVLFRHRGCVTEPIARQFVFDFEPAWSDPNGPATGKSATIEMHSNAREGRITEMFLQAIRYEDASELDQACEVYERIIEKDPGHAPACINLGTICYNRRQFVRAERLYRSATEADPEYALAFFDLGNVLDELKRLPEAIAAYRTAIRLVPGYGDAHYNLALACERTGERRLALRHWTAYLKVDSNSRWAAHARKQIKKILGTESLSVVHRSPRVTEPRALRRASPLESATVPTAG